MQASSFSTAIEEMTMAIDLHLAIRKQHCYLMAVFLSSRK
jgi:succinylglutamate desuccinylase